MFIKEYTDAHGKIALNLEDVSYFAKEKEGTLIYLKGREKPILVHNQYDDLLKDAKVCQRTSISVRADGGYFDVHSK